MFIPAATRNTASHEPVAFFRMLANGTRKAGALRGVEHHRIGGGVLRAEQSVQVEGNRLKISPQVKKISAAQITNVTGS